MIMGGLNQCPYVLWVYTFNLYIDYNHCTIVAYDNVYLGNLSFCFSILVNMAVSFVPLDYVTCLFLVSDLNVM